MVDVAGHVRQQDVDVRKGPKSAQPGRSIQIQHSDLHTVPFDSTMELRFRQVFIAPDFEAKHGVQVPCDKMPLAPSQLGADVPEVHLVPWSGNHAVLGSCSRQTLSFALMCRDRYRPYRRGVAYSRDPTWRGRT